MLTTICKEKIQEVMNAYRQAEEIIIPGSDAHLDMILKVKEDLCHLIRKTDELDEEILSLFNELTKETAQVLVDALLPCIAMANEIITRLKKCVLMDSIAEDLEEFEMLVDNLQEHVDDMLDWRINVPNDLTVLLDELAASFR